MTDDQIDLVDWMHFEKCRAELGAAFIRIMGYFRDDGRKGVAQIEEAMHEENYVALVTPAHTLKVEARHFGANTLAAVAETIELTARSCVETHRFPDELVPDVVRLRALFTATVELFDEATNPLQKRARPALSSVANQDFGRI